MKLSLKVAQGVHEGKLIPIPVSQFLVGREESCQLRPASAAVSKRHCAILVRSGKVLVRDIGSTNGTFVNDEQITEEVEVANGDRLKIGPLEFVIQVEDATETPPPVNKKSDLASAVTPPPKETQKIKTTAPSVGEEDSEKMAALLLGTDDGPPEPITEDKIPAGTTVFEMPAIGDPEAPKTEKPKNPNEGNTSNAAAAILKKYMQRPRG
jgi:pSer/pThr/pTyr-binding forkhead associated (FHA) protein